ncbi:conserved hypothetical protein [Bradyrhizobium oligotrophicum S58]|uniref:Uncharacterized protein n=1 Tax=Bradyrhizobium oligotrophicum S58 TaxID=1245469 RepID=M4Z4H9_9BRAD|nr:hypothetical protein [Bradyrhizobium oligotrophicum]BAM87887.1 conserved hypothetical protein [Bradyrhizobium oligotrophicum S58]
MSSTMAVAVAVGLTSALCYALLVWADRRQSRRRVSSDGGSMDTSSASGDGQGFGLASWFSNTTTDVMGNPMDSGSDSGGDGGGGDGGGGD